MNQRLMAFFIAGCFLIMIGVSLLQGAASAEQALAHGKGAVEDTNPRGLTGQIMLAIGVLLALGSLILQLRRKRPEGPYS